MTLSQLTYSFLKFNQYLLGFLGLNCFYQNITHLKLRYTFHMLPTADRDARSSCLFSVKPAMRQSFSPLVCPAQTDHQPSCSSKPSSLSHELRFYVFFLIAQHQCDNFLMEPNIST